MTARRTVSALLFLVAVVLAGVAALTPLRADRIAELDAEARRLGQLWVEDQTDDALIQESNAFFDEARDLEPPLAPMPALTGALLFAAGAVVARPTRRPPTPADVPAPVDEVV